MQRCQVASRPLYLSGTAATAAAVFGTSRQTDEAGLSGLSGYLCSVWAGGGVIGVQEEAQDANALQSMKVAGTVWGSFKVDGTVHAETSTPASRKAKVRGGMVGNKKQARNIDRHRERERY